VAEKGQTRDPSSHRTPGQITRQVKGYNHEPDNIKKRVQRDQARRELMKEGLVKKGDGKDVGHKVPVRSGGSNARSNLNVETEKKNRGWRR
jgi:hypothetical protein